MKQHENCAIFGIDAQVCFGHPKGGLYVPGGEEVVEPGNKLTAFGVKNGFTIMFSCDWHPPDSNHFKPVGPWPLHGVARTRDAEFLDGLIVPKGAFIVRKGMGKKEDGYDPFEGEAAGGQSAEQILRENNIETITFWGIATDYCLKAGVLTACRLGFKVFVAIDACRAVNKNPGDEQRAIDEMKAAGAIITTVREVLLWAT